MLFTLLNQSQDEKTKLIMMAITIMESEKPVQGGEESYFVTKQAKLAR